MKKTVVFTVFSSLVCAAGAQSSVTLYGLVDAYAGRITTETTGAVRVAKATQNVVNGSGQNSSRWGMRGVEDLGGGLKANFLLEAAFLTDTGAVSNITPQGSTMFGRQATVGLSGSFGTVNLGRQPTAYDGLLGPTNMLYDTNFATTSAVWNTGVVYYQSRASNVIHYKTPSIGGVTAALSYAPGENKTATTPAERSTSFNVQYASGPLLIGYANHIEKQVANGVNNFFGTPLASNAPALPSTVTETRKYNLVAGSYQFGFGKLTGAYGHVRNGRLKDKEFEVGLSVPFGATAIAVGYSHATSTGGGLPELKSRGLSILGTYHLSKLTNLYAGYLNTEVQSNVALGRNTLDRSLLGVGIKKVF